MREVKLGHGLVLLKDGSCPQKMAADTVVSRLWRISLIGMMDSIGQNSPCLDSLRAIQRESLSATDGTISNSKDTGLRHALACIACG